MIKQITITTILSAIIFHPISANAGDDQFMGEITAGGGYVDEFTGVFARGTGLIKVTGDLYMGLEAEHFMDFEDKTSTDSFGTTRQLKLNYSTAGFLIGRVDFEQFGVHARLGARDTSYNRIVTDLDFPSYEVNFDIGKIEAGTGAIYRLDKKQRHGVRFDLGFSTEVSLEADTSTIVELGYVFKF